ncbi:MAG: hypothetical protein HY606_03380 [Planctomycetes bacterium]|nr:hypothetical protein [Planctomycetota bacterium]
MRKKRIFFLISIIISFFTVSCATTIQHLSTPTGKPEVTISNVSKKAIVDRLTNIMIDRGYNVKEITEYKAAYSKRMESVSAAIWYGSKYDSTPEARITFDTVETQANIRIVATLQMVTNPGSAFERTTDLSKNTPDAHNFQDILSNLKSEMESK